MSVIQFPVRLSSSTFALTWAWSDGVGELPTPLFTWFEGNTAEEYAASEKAAFVEIIRLAGRNSQAFTEELEKVYQALSQAPAEFYGWVTREDGNTFGVLVACHKNTAYLAVVDGEVVLLDQVRPDYGAQALVSVLPEYPVGRFQAANARSNEVTGEPGSGGIMRSASGGRSPDADMLRRLLNIKGATRGELSVAIRNGMGRRYRNPQTTNFVDNPEFGRVLFYKTGSGDSTYVTARPGHPDTIVGRLQEVHSNLR